MIILYIGIVYRLGIINQVRNVGTSVIRTFHLSGMAALKGVRIIEVALYQILIRVIDDNYLCSPPLEGLVPIPHSQYIVMHLGQSVQIQEDMCM